MTDVCTECSESLSDGHLCPEARALLAELEGMTSPVIVWERGTVRSVQAPGEEVG